MPFIFSEKYSHVSEKTTDQFYLLIIVILSDDNFILVAVVILLYTFLKKRFDVFYSL